MAEFYSARSWEIPPLPWTNLSPPFSPEKLDLMLRGGWEGEIGRPLTLVVVDEAHGLASENRGLKL